MIRTPVPCRNRRMENSPRSDIGRESSLNVAVTRDPSRVCAVHHAITSYSAFLGGGPHSTSLYSDRESGAGGARKECSGSRSGPDFLSQAIRSFEEERKLETSSSPRGDRALPRKSPAHSGPNRIRPCVAVPDVQGRIHPGISGMVGAGKCQIYVTCSVFTQLMDFERSR